MKSYYCMLTTALFLAIPITSCLAASNNLALIIRSFPDVDASKYHPDVAVQVANAFISAGEQSSLEVLSNLANDSPDPASPNKLSHYEALNSRLCLVCRLLYLPKRPSDPIRPPRLGTPIDLPYDSMDPLSWPDLPFVFSNNIPLSMNLGYALSGISERAKDYLAYSRANGTFRVKFFTEPTQQSVSNALGQVFESAAWKRLRWNDSGPGWRYDLNEDYVRKMLWQQVNNLGKRPTAEGSNFGK